MAEQTTIPSTQTTASADQTTTTVDPGATAAPVVAAPTAPPPTPKPKTGKGQDKELERRVNDELRRRLKMSPEEFTAFQAKGGIVIPQAAFKQRIQREAAKLVGTQTTAQPAGAQPTAPTPQNGKNAALDAERARGDKMQKELDRVRRESMDAIKKAKKAANRAEMERISAEIQSKAHRAGVNEEDIDVALFLFQRAVLTDENLTPEAFFASLKTTRPVLFGSAQAAPPRVVRPTTAPPEALDATGRPRPASTTSPPGPVNAEEMTPEQFKRHQQNYGFTGA